jgi:hypothetical protein
MKIRNVVRTILQVAMVCALVGDMCAQHSQKPLTNADIITMVKNKMPESVVLSAIQSHPPKFDTSTAELIRLKNAGVTENELNAMMTASANGPAAASPPPAQKNAAPAAAANDVPAAPATKSRMPKVYLVDGGSLQELPLEKTQLAETKTKPTSMKSLAGDSAVTQAMQAGVNTATWSAASHMSSEVGGTTVQQAGSIFSGMMSHRTPTVTYVWGVPNPASASVLQTGSPSFSVDFSRVMGVTTDDYEPIIVKLTPAQNTCRIVGATQGKADEQSSPAADWQVYSHFLEDRVTTHSEKLGTGKYKLSAASELSPGEYAVVLRPAAKDKKFSGGDVLRAQGDGLMFDAIWTFQVSDSAQ